MRLVVIDVNDRSCLVGAQQLDRHWVICVGDIDLVPEIRRESCIYQGHCSQFGGVVKIVGGVHDPPLVRGRNFVEGVDPWLLYEDHIVIVVFYRTEDGIMGCFRGIDVRPTDSQLYRGFWSSVRH